MNKLPQNLDWALRNIDDNWLANILPADFNELRRIGYITFFKFCGYCFITSAGRDYLKKYPQVLS